MLENLGGVTSQIARLALDAASQRQEITAHNIANATTPGFVPKRVEFAEQLRAFANEMLATSDTQTIDARYETFKSQIRDGAFVNAKTDQVVEIDMEMVNLAENVLYYRAILEGLSKRGDILRMAIRERSI
jgi:flagellar basal-body rod protein FlgB